MTNSLKGKLVVITGASAGVGRAATLAFAQQGARLALIARGLDGLIAAKKDAENLNAEVKIFSADVSDASSLDDIGDKIESEMGAIDIWINNAMCSVFSPFKQITPAEFKRVTEVTYLGQVYGTMTALKYMQRRNQGTIVLIGSALAFRGIPLQSPYCGAKHGVEGFFDSLRCELIHDASKIHLTIVHLPAMNTPQFDWVLNKLPNKPRPMGIVYQPEVAAKAIVFAATHRRREIYVALPTFETVFGNKIAPGLMDKYLAKIGYQGQQTSEKESSDHQSNVWHPLSGDHGMHGRFGSISHRFSPFLWIVTHRKTFWGSLIVLGLIIIYLIWR